MFSISKKHKAWLCLSILILMCCTLVGVDGATPIAADTNETTGTTDDDVASGSSAADDALVGSTRRTFEIIAEVSLGIITIVTLIVAFPYVWHPINHYFLEPT